MRIETLMLRYGIISNCKYYFSEEEQPSTWKSSNNKALPNMSLPASASVSAKVPTQSVENAAEKSYRMEMYKALLTTRNDLAHNMDCMPYMVASNAALMQLAQSRPSTLTELKNQISMYFYTY